MLWAKPPLIQELLFSVEKKANDLSFLLYRNKFDLFGDKMLR